MEQKLIAKRLGWDGTRYQYCDYDILLAVHAAKGSQEFISEPTSRGFSISTKGSIALRCLVPKLVLWSIVTQKPAQLLKMTEENGRYTCFMRETIFSRNVFYVELKLMLKAEGLVSDL